MRGLFGLARPGPAVLVLFGLASLSSAAVAHELDISVNDDAFRSVFTLTLKDNLRIEGGVLHNSDAGSVISAGLQVTGDVATAGEKLTGGLGFRFAYLDGDGSQREGYALGLGGSVRWALPGYERFALSAEGYWAPEVLCGEDADEYLDGTVRFGYSVTRQADVYLGARYVRADYDNRPAVLFDTGLDIGFNLRF